MALLLASTPVVVDGVVVHDGGREAGAGAGRDAVPHGRGGVVAAGPGVQHPPAHLHVERLGEPRVEHRRRVVADGVVSVAKRISKGQGAWGKMESSTIQIY